MIRELATGFVVIGRNEGERLKQCLQSLPQAVPVVYVDSGSTDGSVAFARSFGVLAVELDMSVPFTAARARNVGWRCLLRDFPNLDAVYFVDGDCEVSASWPETASASLVANEKIAAVFGRRRERHPDQSIYNRMCDDEWDVPVGIASSCGGDALFRVAALLAANGYSDDLIAGEEPDLCLRLRKQGWIILCIEAEMTLHDAAITSWRAWWKRSKRAGFAYTSHVWRHREDADPAWSRQVVSIIFWASMLPLSIFASACLYLANFTRFGFLPILFAMGIYAMQFTRMYQKRMSDLGDARFAMNYSILILLAKLPQFLGLLMFLRGRLLNNSQAIIEYKG